MTTKPKSLAKCAPFCRRSNCLICSAWLCASAYAPVCSSITGAPTS
ncbi:hypothetical protein NEISICOT_00017 [Neisseria sicca ATCC 29256]|uniref:Uncharacterized protein n=1 Tax=Neisseria sicca ATCC 29256 TaxID=547045 RepID=C6M0J4_NEISI|nr:hypothetical protein NEISICOT_00017 [Neisseria sicca ATCC 29256]